MKKTFFLSLITLFIMSSCVSKKEYTSLENRHKKTQDLLNTATIKLNACLEEKSSSETLADAYKEQLSDLKRRNDQLFIQSQDYLELTTKGAENLEKTLESIKEKDLKITRIQDALNRKDSVTFALVTSLKKEIGSSKNKIEISNIVGKSLAKKAVEKKIKKVVFDRNGYPFHGRVKAFADAAREAGLEF